MCPLLIAIERGDPGIAKLCIRCPRVDLNVANRDGKTALILTIEKGNTEILKELLAKDNILENIDIGASDVSCNAGHL